MGGCVVGRAIGKVIGVAVFDPGTRMREQTGDK